MQIANLLTPNRTICCIEAGSKRSALEQLAKLLAQDIAGLDADDLLRRFVARERLGSTGIGHGIAIPHCRCVCSTGAVGALITLTHPIEFDAIDGEPVDILFAMIVPEEAHDEHLKNLAVLATKLSSDEFRQQLRAANSNQDLFQAAVKS